VLVAAAVAAEEVLEHWGVFSTRDFIRTNFGLGPFAQSPTAAVRHPHEVPPAREGEAVHAESLAIEPVPAVVVEITTDPVLATPTNQSSLPVELVPQTPIPSDSGIPHKVSEIIPMEVIEIVQQTEPASAEDTPPESSPLSAEEVLTELLNEISENTPPVSLESHPSSLSLQSPQIDLHALLNAQAEQLAALREKLQQYYTESNQALDYKAKAHETAYREALELRERVYRKELEEKLSQLTAELQASFDRLRLSDRSEVQLAYQQQFEQQKAESERKMEEALKVAVENVEAQYTARLAEEINKFDSKLTEAIASEDAKYTATANARFRALDQLRGEVALLEAELGANAAKLRDSVNLHNVSAALFELSTSSLTSPTKTSFKTELDRLEAASKGLQAGDAVVSTVAEVLRPIANEGVASYPHSSFLISPSPFLSFPP
jgi:hypothetical protein